MQAFSQDSSIYDALIAIRTSQEKLSPDMQPIRAVLSSRR